MKLLPNFLLLTALLLGCCLPGRAQRPVWFVVADKTQLQPINYPVTSATDLRGNTYTWQTIAGPTRIGTATLSTTPNRIDPVTGLVTAWNQDVCLAKFRPSGQLAWVRQGGGNFTNQATALAIDERGNIFVAGNNWSRFHFDRTRVPALADSGTFLARVDTSGTLRWARPLSTYPNVINRTLQIKKLTTDGLGNCVVLGHSLNTAAVGTQPLTVTGRYETFLAKYDAAGAGQWVRQLFSTSRALNASSIEAQLTADGAGNVTVAGTCNDTVTVGVNGPRLAYSATGSQLNTFVIRYDRQGLVLWVRRGSSTSVGGIKADNLGNAYLTGYGSGSFTRFGALSVLGGSAFVMKYNQAGTEQWLNGIGSGSFGTALATDAAGNVYAGGATSGAIRLGPFGLPQPVGGSNGFLLSYSPAGAPRWLYGFGGGRAFDNDRADGLGLDARQNLYATVSSDSATYLGGRAVSGSAGGTVLVRLTQRANRLAGKVYLDRNNNGRRDTSETAFPRPVVMTNTADGQLFSAEPLFDAGFQAFADTGAWAVQPAVLPRYHTVRQPAPGRYRGRFAGYNQVADTLNFGLVATPNQTDVRLSLTPYGAARPGFLTRYRLTLENVGTATVAGGTATLALDARVAYVSSSPAAARSGQTLTWTYASLPPFARREFEVLGSLPVNTPLGTVLTTAADAPLPADLVPADNTATAAQTVTGSFDPNDITVNYQRLTPAQVAAGQPLDYTIRFQNLGTDTAFAVVIIDTLSLPKFSLGSLQLVAQSHNCLWSLARNGELTVRFLDIKLPHRGVDVIRSQGFVRFRVLPRASLAVGDVIPNRAHITFDYNAPLRTNTATTAVLLPTATAAPRPGLAWEVFPNPATTAFTIAATLLTGGPVSLLLLDALGRPVRRQHLLAPAGPLRETLAVQGLAPGVYVLQVALPSGTVSKRVVVE